ncbi:hypothetical protein BDF19DRAFT_499946 [Syncephalis fuscata]|nr:hypothetical protein BDF19DRAFT_499946 [Syncephalis fuscata]
MSKYKLRVSVGPSSAQQVPITPNDDEYPAQVDGEHFRGQVWIRIRNCEAFAAPTKLPAVSAPQTAEYFKHAPNTTFAITIRGQFLQSFLANDIVFGNVFDAPIRLPMGANLAVRAMRMFIDPGLEADLYAEKPWALSPVLCTMQSVAVRQKDDNGNKGEETAEEILQPLKEHNGPLFPDMKARTASARRSYFAKPANQQAIELSSRYEYAMEFCNGILDFNTLGVRIPGWGSVSLLSYWDEQPLSYVMRTRDGASTLLVIKFELIAVERNDTESNLSSKS